MSASNLCPYPSVARSSKSAVVSQLCNLKSAGVFAAGKFISDSNTFRVIGTDATATTVQSFGLGEYIAGSSIAHLYDGWRYLGTALRAYCQNDVGVCGHAAYYAELRGAMSFLAANGVVSFRRGLGYLDSQARGRLLSSDGGTHNVVWDALKSLVNSSGVCADKVVLSDIICPGGHSISDWMSEWNGNVAQNQALYANFLLSCGTDIGKYEADRNGRNKFSYSPTEFEGYLNNSFSVISGSIGRFWSFFSPISGGEFYEFDFFLLRKLLHMQKKALGLTVFDFRRRIERAVAALARSEPERAYFFGNLYARRNREPFLSSSNVMCNGDKAIHEGMLLRASCMLRIATAACRELLVSAGVTSQDLGTWLINCQKHKFMWQAPVSNFKYAELWTDVEDSLESLDTYAPRGNETWLETEARSLEILSRTEYIMLWGLGL